MSAVGDIMAYAATQIAAITPVVRPSSPFRLWPGVEPLEKGAKDDGRERDFQIRMARNSTYESEWGACRSQSDEMQVRVLYVLHGNVSVLEAQMDEDHEQIIKALTAPGLSWPTSYMGLLPDGGADEDVGASNDIRIHRVSFRLTYQQGF